MEKILMELALFKKKGGESLFNASHLIIYLLCPLELHCVELQTTPDSVRFSSLNDFSHHALFDEQELVFFP